MIKNLIIISTVGLLGITGLYAQENKNGQKTAFGLKAGLNFSNVWDAKEQEFEADGKAGFAGGVFLGIPIVGFLGLQPEILVSQKGFKGSGTLLGTPYSFNRTTTYLDVPLQLQINPAKFVTILAGPQISFLLKQNDTYNFGANSVEQEKEFDNENLRKSIFGFTGGVDFKFNSFLISTKVGWDFQENREDGTSVTPRYKNQWLQLTLGYIF